MVNSPNSASFFNDSSNFYSQLNITGNFSKGWETFKDVFNPSLNALIAKIKSFVENNHKTIFFIFCMLFTYKFAFLRFMVSALITYYFENKLYQPQGPIISTHNLALSTMGAMGLALHKISYPLSNPFFYFAPILSGCAFSKTIYALYRSYFPIS